ncbi:MULTISPECIES: acyl-CoA dehydrogenase family protein [Nocardia]|uniref:acyl-CoA dehydrogenase family protein n=1 Tax=Nocardia TaxID=1817 RepID=UPI000BEFF671|nr:MULTISPECIES: acyl-CoA dehydrogenase family protein [Nocardia]MBF6314224.1 acyl-CoA dehydrogenase family protein [Nocardia farcinica]MBF6574907.1 acyl-CoA dehydrogenase family protein [Nocardia farcinica]PEH76276.1 acyl-CoA dehydrogenase [Nocardia sp. FDAARGOS_372]UEX20641.1 acyl-CoA dehydrogenase family protein [Nocardia farcinica]SUE27906.1 acyl-CoA dehydrogenase [Nocardia farcinica]
MDFAYDARTEELRASLLEFMETHIYPAEPVFREQLAQLEDRWAWDSVPVLAELRAEARRRGLWNLFLPGDEGAGLTNLQYAPLAEITGRSGHLAPAVLNCAAPDTGNMEVLAQFGTEEQRTQWLEPLLDGRIRSAFAMTEPDVASSDATNIATRIERDGDDYVINGRKWWITGAMNPNARIFIVMGKTDPQASRHRQQSMILVPRDTPGVVIERGMEVFGYDDHEHGGHAEMTFTDVRVPAANLIGGESYGFAIAQARLGPGRIHHCMRAIGVAERAIEAMCARAEERVAFGRPLSDQGVIRDWIAESRVKIEQLRLLVLKTAWLMDTVGNKGAHTEIQAIKIATPATVQWILDKAIQVHGAAGLSPDFSLAAAYAGNRTLRFADGPDEVHKNALAKNELRKQREAR